MTSLRDGQICQFAGAVPYPGTALYSQMAGQGRLTTNNWDRYDTRHVVYQPAAISPEQLKAGYDWAYREFYAWPSILTAARAHQSPKHSLKHLAYSAGWKKFEPAWDLAIRVRQLAQMRPMLEAVLSPVKRHARPTESAFGLDSHQPIG